MAQTIIGVGDAKAVKKFSAFLAVDVPKKSYWSANFTGEGEPPELPVQRITDLDNGAGDLVTYDLNMLMTMQPVEGEETLENREEKLQFYTDSVYIDQMRGGVNTGGKMTQKRTVHNLRNIARARQTDWWARAIDELHFIYASGARGVNSDFLFPTSYTGFAGNSLTSPDAYHIDYAGGRAGVSTITSADTMKCSEIDKIVTYLDTLGGGTDGIPGMEPIQVGGQGKHFVCVMHPYQLHTLKADYGETGWLTIQKAIGAAYGDKSPIFTGAAGMHNNVVLHSHKNVIKFSNYGSTSNLPAARALVLGRQALVVSYGSPGNKLRFSWNEETEDRGDKVVITSAAIFGLKKVTFNGLDFGLMAFDTYATTP